MLAEPVLPLAAFPPTLPRTVREHWPRRPSQGVYSKHLGCWKPCSYPSLYQVWVPVLALVLSLSRPRAPLLVLPRVNASLAQLVILKEVNVQNGSRQCRRRSPSLGAPRWAGAKALRWLWTHRPPVGGLSLSSLQTCAWKASACQGVLWGTNTASTLAAACLLQRISWCFQETESELKCSSALKED